MSQHLLNVGPLRYVLLRFFLSFSFGIRQVVQDFLTTVNLSRARSNRASLKVRDALRFLQPRDFNRDAAIKSYEEYEVRTFVRCA